MRVRFRLPDPLAPGLSRMVTFSLLAHVLLAAAAMTLPPLLPSAPPPSWGPVLVGTLVKLPPSPSPAVRQPQPARAKPSSPPPPRKKAPSRKRRPPAKKPAVKNPPREEARKVANPTPPQAEASPSTPQTSGQPGPSTSPSDQPAGIGLSFQGATFGYAYYNSQLINKLRSNWQRPLRPDGSSAPISTRVFFRIHQNGSVSNIRLDSPSASPELDRSALRAVQQASPFPPLPPQFTKDHLDLAITFTLEPSGL